MKTQKTILTGLLAAMLPAAAGAQTFNEADYTPEQTTFRLFAPDNAKP